MTTDLGAQWRVIADEPIPVERFGQDHYSTLLYVESRAVDCGGRLNHDHMRCDRGRHPVLAAAGRCGGADFGGGGYPTRLRLINAQSCEVADHDDYDCLDDLVAAGWLTVNMPAPDPVRDVYLDATGAVVTAGGGEPVRVSMLTGLDELSLGVAATWHLTDMGHALAAAARRHLAEGAAVASLADLLFPQPN